MATIRIRATRKYNWARSNPEDPQVAMSETPDVVGVSKENKKEYAEPVLVLLSYIIIIVGVVLGTRLATTWVKPNLKYEVVDGITLFAVFYIVAQAMERLVEPLSELNIPNFGSRKKVEKNKRDRKKRDVLNALATGTTSQQVQDNADDAADHQAKADQIEANTKVLIWAIASFFSMLLSGALGLYLLEVIGVKGAPAWLNILVTGLAVGGGTAPLHKLITLMEKKSENTDEDEGED
jgi:hypothetical protein